MIKIPMLIIIIVLLVTYCVPGTELNALQEFSHLILLANLRDMYYFYSHLTVEKLGYPGGSVR